MSLACRLTTTTRSRSSHIRKHYTCFNENPTKEIIVKSISSLANIETRDKFIAVIAAATVGFIASNVTENAVSTALTNRRNNK